MTSPLLQALNAAQQQAAQIVDGPVLVLAGPGSGKTRLLTHRVAYLIEEVGVDPFHILAVTFTNKAAREMRERLRDLIAEPHTAALTVGTFHSLCSRFLRRDIIHLGRERDFAIYDSDDQERTIKRVLKEFNLDEKKNPPRAILGSISSAKNELVDVAEYARLNRSYFDEIVARCYARYDALLRESNALDFDDLLVHTVRLFVQHPDVLARYHERYRYLLVDEYQDTNRAQYMLIKQLATGHQNLFVVGDEDQSIYAWRGADVRNILQFEDDYPTARIFKLEQNYRSTQAILDTAQALIDGGKKRKHRKQLWTQNDTGTPATLIEGYDQNDEAQRVAEEIVRLRASEGYRLNDFAVMYRTNAQSLAVEEALQRHGLPYQLIGGMRFYDRKEVKDVLAYLRVIANPADNVSLERIINTPGRGIGVTTIGKLQQWATNLGMPLYAALQELAGDGPPATTAPFAAQARKKLLGFLELLDGLIVQRDTLDLDGLLGALLERLRFREALVSEYGSEEGAERWENVQALFVRAADVGALPREEQLASFLEQVALVADLDRLDARADAVTCITLHQAKGLEYPVVFLIGLEEGRLPHSRSMDEQDKLDEERRLLYVGMTRARERLYLLYAYRRIMHGRTDFSTRSRFLADIPPGMLRQLGQVAPSTPTASRLARHIGTSTGAAANTRQPARQAPGTRQVRFAPGQRVRHRTFGEGIVVSSKPMGDDEEVVVHFEKKGEKKLMASFAGLQPC